MPDVLCLGILIADIFGSPLDSFPAAGELALIDRYLLSAGGCASNTAAALKRLGRSPSVLGKVGEDLFGDFVLQDLKRMGIDSYLVKRSQACPTSFTFILNVRGEDRRYIHCFGANADFSISDVDTTALEGARALYVGGYLAMPAFRSGDLAQLFREAKQRGLMTVLDVVIPAGRSPSLADLEQILAWTDAFLPNSDEARALTGRSNPMDQAAVLARVNPDCTIVITRGREGLLARRGKQAFQAGAFPIAAVDESGSGDAFSAGLLTGMLEDWSLERSLRLASAVGASCTRALGCHDGVFSFQEAVAFISQNELEIARIDR
jgi:sugar/nucleoside kinase (ribokinase family)